MSLRLSGSVPGVFAEARVMSNSLSGTKNKPNFKVMDWSDPPTPDQLTRFHAAFNTMREVLSGFISPHTHKPIPLSFDTTSFSAPTIAAVKTGKSKRDVATTPHLAAEYALELDRRVPELEPLILKDPIVAARYAIHFGFRWPELERVVLRRPRSILSPNNPYGRADSVDYDWQRYEKEIMKSSIEAMALEPELRARLAELDGPVSKLTDEPGRTNSGA